MDFDDLHQLLAPHGWRCESGVLQSPSGGFWFDRRRFDHDIRGIYYPAARRVHSFGQQPERHELHPLVAALGAHPQLQHLSRRLTSLQSRLASFAEEHAMTLALWSFGYPSVRLTARHPVVGVAVLESIVQDSLAVDLNACHWIDDHQLHARLSRRATFTQLSAPEDIDVSLKLALAFLFASPDRTEFPGRAVLPSHEDIVDRDREYWANFSVLR